MSCSNQFAFGYLYGKLEQINCDGHSSFADFINYANNPRGSILADFPITEDIVGDILNLYSHYETILHNDTEYYIVGDVYYNDDDDAEDVYGIVYLDYIKNKFVLLGYDEEREVLEAYRPIYQENEKKRLEQLEELRKLNPPKPVSTAIKVKRVNAQLEPKGKNDGGIYFLDSENNLYDPETKEQIGVVVDGKIVLR